MEPRPRVGAVHALTNSIGPTQAAFARRWPEADVAHLMDGSLYLDRSRGTADAAELARRIERLIRHSAATGAQGILFTGSFFGAAVEAAKSSVSVPVLTSFEGLVERALALEMPLAVLSTAPDSATLLVAELRGAAAARGIPVEVDGATVEGAMPALLAGDAERHDRLVIGAIEGLPVGAAVVIAQFSMERVIERVTRASPVIGPATEGADKLRRLLRGAD